MEIEAPVWKAVQKVPIKAVQKVPEPFKAGAARIPLPKTSKNKFKA
jgi:hypothetical protein